MIRISLVVPIYNALEDVKLLLKSLNENFNFGLGEIILINDFSNEETTNYLNEFASNNKLFKLLVNEQNLGFVKTCNKGMKISQGEIVVLLNSDTKIPKEFCERIIKCFESDLKIGLASPISSSSNSYYIPLKDTNSLEEMNLIIRKYHKCRYPLIPSAEGFCFCIRRKVIEDQGCFDEVWGKGYHEEVDFAYRAINNGWKNVLIDDLYVYHKRHASFGKKGRFEQIERNKSEFERRWGGFRKDYRRKNNLRNPIKAIRMKLFIRKLLGHFIN